MTYKDIAQSVIELEAGELLKLSSKLTGVFDDAVNEVLSSKGRVIVCGMGKSGHIGKKIFATLVSTGTPSMFLHPGEAFHGDLGMVQPEDVFLAISNSGETEELVRLIPFLKDNGNTLISMTGRPESSLAVASKYHIDIGVENEACPLQLAPTTSTTATLVMGDAFAISLMKARNFKPENFARFHPGGSLGRKLLGRVSDFAKPAVSVGVNDDFKTVLGRMAQSEGGIVAVIDRGGLVGVITDGDIKRVLSKHEISSFVDFCANDFMSADPKCVSIDTKCSDADQLMNSFGVNSLLVVDQQEEYFIYQNLNRR
ncbi:KpsF/GutQ family sugar-phosphate isomerase [Microbulbifer agarilyticus]|uniref:KpsF/GutQ family sugar-phosphate isomerase n=1 Tax=Microbulbifer agarilyticus TaxID=260552 RepID=UPI001C95BCF1|nr:KpsF/GutQ family sugar-phosphate isomerase [Microbulbifer agarilyticus]MBY6212238.1 KpsF/GutQ family sugar-phosphate isomerase [Microbulbifer agarilyticus]